MKRLIRLCLDAARGALRWRLLALLAAAPLLPTLVLALPAWKLLGQRLDYTAHSAALAQALDLLALSDLMAVLDRHALAFQVAATVAAALALLLSPLLTGAVVTAARGAYREGAGADIPLTFRELLAGAVDEYPRMFRMLLWSGVVLLAAWLAGDALRTWAGATWHRDATPTDGRHLRWAAAAAAALLLAFACVTLEAGRAALALDRRRTSAVRAWWLGLGLLRARPLAMFGSYAALGAVALAGAALLGLARLHLPRVDLPGFLLALLLTQIIAALLAWYRAARLYAFIIINKS
ncbi:hypothetical protein [Pseudoduganella namucuonensis]|uniref:YihY/virulence factor BrkB family protein n=1 Tax=Pseudoduganella namucuonensis TaxID=1035707 RepID=A0A1I7I3F2_9BURK|nr:hypothetical protein [Pseudoduganella namucuonensis]SFU67451.1 hypothetical protein SAMN05216552_100764 [Pseudoduganella namucuonensis]